jgi:hypothetical protein
VHLILLRSWRRECVVPVGRQGRAEMDTLRNGLDDVSCSFPETRLTASRELCEKPQGMLLGETLLEAASLRQKQATYAFTAGP